ncbi:protein mono-ADP-ribosyltransferase PARP12-like isoform X2 [Styela clava]
MFQYTLPVRTMINAKAVSIYILLSLFQHANSNINRCTESSCDEDICCSGIYVASCCPQESSEVAKAARGVFKTVRDILAGNRAREYERKIVFTILAAFLAALFGIFVTILWECWRWIGRDIANHVDINEDVRNRHNFDEVENIEEINNSIAADFPPDWINIPFGTGYNKRKIVHGHQEYDDVLAAFQQNGLPHCRVLKIEKIQNPMIFNQFENRKSYVMEKYNGEEVTEFLFHGTKSHHVESICSSGFVVNFAGDNGHAFGKGIYFARQSSYSLHYTGNSRERSMFCAEVIVGKYTKGSKHLREEPVEGNLRYDSVVDNMNDPNIFVVFREASSYPTYLITFLS